MTAAPLVALALVAALAQAPPVPAERIADIQVQGNLATTDAEVRRIAGVEIGGTAGPTIVDEVDTRLRASKRFERVQVLKRFASIADPTQISLVIIVDEGPVHVELTGDPNNPTRVVRNRGPRLMFLPILDAEDGYGLSYGARLAIPNPFGDSSRVSFPLVWGGEKKAAIELEKRYATGPLTRVMAGTSVDQRTNPFYDRDDRRARAWARAEHDVTPRLRFGATAGWQHVSFAGTDASLPHVGADVIFDTRLDPFLARNAVYARAALDRFDAPTGGVTITDLEARGYLGLFRQNILVVRALRTGSGDALPPYLQPLLGGMANLRGFKAGTAAGDVLTAGSAEALVPLTSPLRIGKVGVSVFTDIGTVYDHGARLEDQRFRRGAGGSVWFSAAFVRFSVAVAHGVDAGTRVHVGGGVTF